MDQIIETTTIEELERQQVTGTGVKLSEQNKAVRAMKPGDAIMVTHQGYAKCREEKKSACSMLQSLRTLCRNNREQYFHFMHLEDGKLGIACFPRGGNR